MSSPDPIDLANQRFIHYNFYYDTFHPFCQHGSIDPLCRPLVFVQNPGALFGARESNPPFSLSLSHAPVIHQSHCDLLSRLSFFKPSGAIPLHGCRLLVRNFLPPHPRIDPLLDLLWSLPIISFLLGPKNSDGDSDWDRPHGEPLRVHQCMIRTTRISLELPNLPAPWKGKTAVWVSDTHLGQVRNHRFAQHIANTIQNLGPDIVFIGGDLYDGGEAMDLNHMIRPFSQISSPYGTYFITGNHEEFYDNTPYLRAVRQAGIRVLYNEMVELDGLQIIGVDYLDSRNQEQFKTLLQKMGIDRQKPSLLLKHTPFDLEVTRDQGITVQLSGHTHQGQVFLFRFITFQVYKGYDYGLKRFGDLLVYTSSGTGTWGPPMRLDTKPEIVVIKFI